MLPCALAHPAGARRLLRHGDPQAGIHTVAATLSSPQPFPPFLLCFRFLSNNNFTGTVPESWGAEGALPNLQLLRLDSNALTGSLPAWNASSLPALLVL